ncbi:hypothetical protein MMEU_2025 [Mycobacterium marinum str. Europe]|nr:hypothetical protein MMEU_2025 [Mycobacterium marinum str. Europe]
MMVLAFRVLGYPAHGIDPIEKRCKLDGSAQRSIGPLPAVEAGQFGVYLLIR